MLLKHEYRRQVETLGWKKMKRIAIDMDEVMADTMGKVPGPVQQRFQPGTHTAALPRTARCSK